MKIGVLADTHIPDRLPSLPGSVRRAFDGLDIILHAGDICRLDVLRALQESFTLTFGVYGEHDDAEVQQFLRARQTVEFRRRRIGLIHGNLAASLSWVGRLRQALRPPSTEEVLDALHGEFAGELVHCIVFGHTHQPLVVFRNGVLFFNPGAVAAGKGQRPSVGVLNITDRSITADIIYL